MIKKRLYIVQQYTGDVELDTELGTARKAFDSLWIIWNGTRRDLATVHK